MEKITKTEEEWQKELTPEQYKILREGETEAPFSGKYNKENAKGIYKCAACGQELFSSDAKFDSSTGWPSFTQPIQSVQYYVYVLRINNGQLYVGSTNNLVRRVTEHKNGKVFTTKKYLPIALIHYETYDSEKEARLREKTLKHHGSAFAKLKAKIYKNQEIPLAGFTDPVNRENVELLPDNSQGIQRLEVLCKRCGSHLGHVFDDGPSDKGGKRFCINSECLKLEKRQTS